MSFKYINPGYAKFFVIKSSVGQYKELDQSTSRTGVAVYSANTSDYIKISTTPDEIWIKMSIYIPTTGEIYIGTRGSDILRNGIKIHYTKISIMQNSNYIEILSNSSLDDIGLRLGQINSIWVHLKHGESGFLEFQINNKKYDKIVYQAKKATAYDGEITILSYISDHKISEIIISDEYISPYERVVPLAVSNTVTDMETLESGLYVADNASETLLQSVTTTSLANEYGSDAQVTGIALIGNPAYEVDDVIGSLTAISKHNGVLTERNKITLLTDSDAMIVSSFALPTDTTVADLADYQFGWRSEE